MRKYVITAIILGCTVFIASIVYHQWKVYQYKTHTAHLLIEVVHQSNQLHVQLHFSQMNPGQYDIHMPDSFHEVKGITTLKGKTVVTIPASGEKNVSYSIGLALTKPVVVKRYLPTIGVPASLQIRSSIELTEHQNRKGSWVVGLHTEKVKKAEIDFYTGTVASLDSELIWDANIQTSDSVKGVTVFNQRQLSRQQKKEIEKIAATLPNRAMNLIFTSALPTRAYEVAGVVNEEDELKRVMFYTLLKQQSATQSDIEQVMYALYMHQPSGNKKSTYLYQQITKKLTQEEKEQLLQYYLQHPKNRDRKQLDSYLSKITHYAVHFFEENKEKDVPFLFYQPQNLVVAKKKYDTVVIADTEKNWYPLSTVATGLGFSLKQIQNQLVLTRENETYVLYTNHPFFLQNGQQYAVTFKPLKKYNEQWYANQDLLQYVLQLTIARNDKHIIVY